MSTESSPWDSTPVTYTATGISPGFSGGRTSGSIALSSMELSFDSETGKAAFPLDQLRIRIGGARNRLVFFSHANFPEWTVYTSDKRILSDPCLANSTDLASESQRLTRERKLGIRYSMVLAVACVAILYGLFYVRTPLIAALAEQIPAEMEAKIGQASFAQTTAASRFIEDSTVTTALASLAEPLLKSLGEYEGEPFSIYIVEEASVNAFAMPGGFIVVHSGLLLKAESAEEVAGVLAHEIAHVTHGHSIRKIIGTLGLYTLVSTFLGDMGGITAVLIDSGTMMAALQFSRDFEREADDAGWDYLTAAEVDPRGMIRFFEKLSQETGNDSSTSGTVLSFFDTHPATSDRIAYLGQKLDQYEGNVRPLMDGRTFQSFQSDLKSSIRAE